MSALQIDLFLPAGGPRVPSLGDCEPIPPGPYRVTMLWDMTLCRYVPPFGIIAADERVVVGHIDHLAMAQRVAELLNGEGGA